jgi:hypothetical protein
VQTSPSSIPLLQLSSHVAFDANGLLSWYSMSNDLRNEVTSWNVLSPYMWYHVDW